MVYSNKFFYNDTPTFLRMLISTSSLFLSLFYVAEGQDLVKRIVKGSKQEKTVFAENNSIAYQNYARSNETEAINNLSCNLTNDSAVTAPQLNALPVPQQVSLSGRQFLFGKNWVLALKSSVSKDDPAVRSLAEGLQDRFDLKIIPAKKENSVNPLPAIYLNIEPGTVTIGQTADTNRTALAQQAYRLKLTPDSINITANAQAGLFYGVQTLLQLVKTQTEKISLPAGEITDWPDTEVRMIYWDDAHHLEHFDALKRIIRQAAYFKINAFSLKLEGHFNFKTAKPIVEPYALTAAQYQELTDYAKAHYIDLIPYLDAPGHVAFILKHPEYAQLRAFPNSNYELSVTNPGTDTLLLNMFDELINANKGGKYILLSTDEAYYVGKAADDKKQAEVLGGRGKLFAQFINRIADELHKRGRKVIIWGEYPLTPSDITSLSSHIINGVYDSAWAPKFKAHGMRQFIYTYTQGGEVLFPVYYPLSSGDSIKDKELDRFTGRVEGMRQTISSAVAQKKSDFTGVIIAGWADAGLHPETFWLGYAAGAATGWNHTSKTKELTEKFYTSFYGSGTTEMDTIYQLLSKQAQFYDDSWDWEDSRWRTPIFGNSEEIYTTAKPAKDQILPMLPVPLASDLSVKSDWSNANKKRLQDAEKFLKENNKLTDLLHKNLRSVQYNQYNVEVMLSVALLCRQNLNMLLQLQHIYTLLQQSAKVALKDASAAVSLIDQALDEAKIIQKQRNETLQSLTKVWYKEWNSRVGEANGRRYLNIVDDVKDHQPGRTADMSYLVYRQLHYSLDKWVENVLNNRNVFARKNHLPLKKEKLQWKFLD